MSVKVRFAPSPTGRLHVGNARTAIITWLFARKNNGHFLLRIDDTDTERSQDMYVTDIKDNLQWLGLEWDSVVHQKDRNSNYESAIQKLKDIGRLYPCYETPEELGLKRKAQLSRGLPPIYDRSSLRLSDKEKEKYEAAGRRPHWRFKLVHDTIMWNDLIRGEQSFEGKDLSDPVLIREDGRPLYHICSVVDDIEFNITHIIRGEDHVTNSAAHKQMFEALGEQAPLMAHLPLISDLGGGKLSKRLGSLSLNDLREEDQLEPLAIMSYMARLGSSEPIEPYTEAAPLIDSFQLSKFSRSTPKFDPSELLRLNSRILHATGYDQIKHRLPETIDQKTWETLRPNLEKFSDISTWHEILYGDIMQATSTPHTPLTDPEETEFLAKAAMLLPDEPWTEQTWGSWTKRIQSETGRKGRQLYMPLRKALTGQDHGPELGPLIPIIGPEKVRSRLLATSQKAA